MDNPGEIYNFNEHEVKRKIKKVLVNKENIFKKGLKHVEEYMINNMSMMMGNNNEQLRRMGLENIKVETEFFYKLGGSYEDMGDQVEEVNRKIEALQGELSELHMKMGKSQLTKQNEPSMLYAYVSQTLNIKDKTLEYEDILQEMKDFQDLVNDEHREKRRLFKNLIMGTSKQMLKVEQEYQKNDAERMKQVLQLYKNVSSMMDLFWKKIEKFAWEHLKKDLQQELIKKKKQNLDKFIQDAIKVSINDQERYIFDKKIKGTGGERKGTTAQSGQSSSSTKVGIDKNVAATSSSKTKTNEDEEELVEDEYVFDKDEEKMELDDLKLEDEMDSDKEENELDDLQKDLEMPLEELLKMYKQQSNGDFDDEYEEEFSDYTEDQTPDDNDDEMHKDNQESPVEPAEQDAVVEPDQEHESPVEVDQDHEELVEDEYVFDKDEEKMELDDLKLEDEMDSDKEENELDDLQKDLEMPLEELLKMYKQQSNGDFDDEYEEEFSDYTEDQTPDDNDDEMQQDDQESVTRQEDDNGLSEVSEDDLSDMTSKENTDSKDGTEGGEVKVPFLIKAVLRPYQKEGLGWLVSLYERGINGILADEMGLGKTLQTISLLAYLACYKENWGPHIIIVPTSILLNWVMEFNRFCPGFKVLAYYGTPAERARRRSGWNRPHSFNVLVSSYSIVVQDAYVLKRRAWEYMILDEAQNIKNFNSKRWQTLLTFNTKYRLLLTGTPLQNSLQELWSLMHFILPNVFTSHTQFNIWFTDPLNQALDNLYSSNPLYKNENDLENKEKEEMNRNNMELVEKLHVIFRPYLLRRLKKDVEKQMPSKYEHVLKCTLTKRQQVLYDEFISLYNLNSKGLDKERLSYRSMLNILMQLRKICNHPDQLKSRDVQIPIEFNIEPLTLPSMFKVIETGSIYNRRNGDEESLVSETNGTYGNGMYGNGRNGSDRLIVDKRVTRRRLDLNLNSECLIHTLLRNYNASNNNGNNSITNLNNNITNGYNKTNGMGYAAQAGNSWGVDTRARGNGCSKTNLTNPNAEEALESVFNFNLKNDLEMNKMIEAYAPLVENFLVLPTKVVSRPIKLYYSGETGVNHNIRNDWLIREVTTKVFERDDKEYYAKNKVTLEAINSQYRLLFPSKRALNDDCGKFRVLGPLLLRLKSEGHRCIIYTQFSKMLDILENWINFMGFTYTRLDGSTKIDMRQKIVNRFNENTKIFLFISSTRSGGVGITLTGADTVIFYDTDWNPAIDRQAMDRCHRIGQTKDVNVYRLISEHTVEENIWRKQLQKRKLDDLIVDQGQFDIQHNAWFSNIDTLINIFQSKKDDDEEDNIYGKTILHESNVGETNLKGTGVKSLKMLIEVEDADDSMALKKLTKENEKINKEDFENDMINTIPGLVTYCIKFLLKYQTAALERQVELMKVKIQVEDYQNKQDDEEGDEDDIYTDYDSEDEVGEGSNEEEEEEDQEEEDDDDDE
ncbi:DEAD-box family helicase [Theileria orientalis strain Shintoku]|uniref:DEAD-box family helicase n=1 Tax=Theileria orientalis strain Shintoku TaxID=869250 RepID=J4C309_THEOR|nr:DEAD-box family helicase [Theileria orientalis strain Shintoku]BAM39621.1 DEAD-box family helicase [Theileria orientalis strain Shintoku]|eukprot:XP_009689922.1 DEAD-box family helicase [Theileria orientalis strain Shintoku]